jgi:hypothetical protein
VDHTSVRSIDDAYPRKGEACTDEVLLAEPCTSSSDLIQADDDEDLDGHGGSDTKDAAYQ